MPRPLTGGMMAAAVGLAALVAVAADDPPPAPVGRKALPAGDVVPLIEQLASRDYREREKANKALNALGDRALPHLKAAMAKSDSPEAQRRLEVMVTRMERELFLAPSRVSLKAKNQPMKATLKDLCRQAGYELKNDPMVAHRVTMEFDNLPFWEAVARVCDPPGVRLDMTNDDKNDFQAYAAGDQTSPYTCVSGPFRFTANNISTSRSLQLANIPKAGPANNGEYLNLNGMVQGEPKCPIVGVGGGVIVTKAVDDTGADMAPPADGQVIAYQPGNFYRAQTQAFNLNLTRGSRDAKVIKELRGKMGLVLLSETRPGVVVDKLAGVKKGKFAGTHTDLDVGEVTVAENSVTFAATFRQRDLDPNDHNWWNGVIQRMQLLDDHGQKWAMNNIEQSGTGVGTMTAKMTFAPADPKKAGKPVKFQIVEWVTVRTEVEFCFKNIPLP